MKKECDYIKCIKTAGGKHINVLVKVDLENNNKLYCRFFKGKKTLPDYYKIVIPANILENNKFKELAETKFVARFPDIISYKESRKSTSEGSKKQIPIYKTQTLDLTPNQLIEQIKVVRQNDYFDLDAQKKYKFDKCSHWGFSKKQQKWLMDVTTATEINDKDIHITAALLGWSTKKFSVTHAQCIDSIGVIIFNQTFKDTYDEIKFKEIFTHELAHLKNYRTFGHLGNGGHNASWLIHNYELNKKAFGNEDAKFILVRDMHKYGANKINYPDKQPDISEYYDLKDQASIALVAHKFGLKLESDNPFIEDFNKDTDIKETVKEFLWEHSDKFEIYDSWEHPAWVNDETKYRAIDRFYAETDAMNKNNNEIKQVGKSHSLVDDNEMEK